MKKNLKYFLLVLVLIILAVAAGIHYRQSKNDLNYLPTDLFEYNNLNNLKDNANIVETENDLNSNLTKENTNTNMQETLEYKTVTLKTNMGDIVFQLNEDKPLTTQNFISLAKDGFYNDVRFHRVIEGFMIQTGDPLSKDESQKGYWGTGGPGYKFNDELTGEEVYEMGIVAMANSGPNTNGSQFFIMTSNTQLSPDYTIFGKVIAGQDIANKIQTVATNERDVPLEDIIINSVELK